jgi:RNA polymerase sigma factor (sigma-70 family)
MASDSLKKALERVRHALPPLNGGDQTDEQLLRQFLAERDELAFASLVRRHGDMVLGLCRRVLGNVHDSEDAFQAAFLILAQKAQSVINRQAVGGWLYTVAFRIALQAKAANACRRHKERQVKELPHPAVVAADANDWLPLFDRELSRLPEKYRTAIVLCELEGRPRKDVAHQLQLPEGTLSSRLAAARRMLARRLTRAGLAITGSTLAAVPSQAKASAHVSAALVWSTAQAATLVAAGQLAAVPGTVAVLTKGALKAMFIAKLKGAMVMVAAAMLGMGAICWSAGGGPGAAQAGQGQDSELASLRKENELLKINLRVTLEKIGAQETELANLKKTLHANKAAANQVHFLHRTQVSIPEQDITLHADRNLLHGTLLPGRSLEVNTILPQQTVLHQVDPNPQLAQEVEAAVKTLLKAHNPADRKRVLEALDRVRHKLAEEPHK